MIIKIYIQFHLQSFLIQNTDQHRKTFKIFQRYFLIILFASLQQLMRKVLFKEPIHISFPHRGKLRKIEHHKLEANPIETDMLLTPSNILFQKTQRKIKHYSYFKDQPNNQHLSFLNELALTGKEPSGGAFRAIHTALSNDIQRGFPLRSITQIRPFRRGIRSNKKTINGTIEIQSLKQIPKMKRKGTPSHRNHMSQLIVYKEPLIVKENEQHQEFYIYKSPSSSPFNDNDSPQRIDGNKIQPFKKYQIRQFHRSGLSQRNNLANQPNQ